MAAVLIIFVLTKYRNMNIRTDEPLAIKAMMELQNYVGQTSISKTNHELIKIRASQINGCAYCIDMHSKEAIKNGETIQRILVLSSWPEARHLFSEEEQVILTITEEITQIQERGLSDSTRQQALKFFSDNELAQIVMAVIAINCWNRIAISSHLKV